MTGLVRKASLLCAGGLLLASAAMANVPDAAHSTIPCGIRLVGSTSSVADPLGQFTVTVRDLSNNPLANSTVTIDFTNCTPDIKLGTQAAQVFAGLVLDCPTHAARMLTNTSGVATFRIIGGSNTATPAAAFKCAKVLADGVLLGNVNVACHDLNSAGGLNGADVSLCITDLFAGATTRARSDLDCTGTTNGADASLYLT